MEVAIIKDRIIWQFGKDNNGNEFGAKDYTALPPQEILTILEMAINEVKKDLHDTN
jgi:hypothetical protein